MPFTKKVSVKISGPETPETEHYYGKTMRNREVQAIARLTGVLSPIDGHGDYTDFAMQLYIAGIVALSGKSEEECLKTISGSKN